MKYEIVEMDSKEGKWRAYKIERNGKAILVDVALAHAYRLGFEAYLELEADRHCGKERAA